MAHTFFLAHASPDKPEIRRLYDALVAAGLTCFLDEVDVLPGDDWDLEIPKAHRLTQVTLVVVSPNYDGAYYLRDEVHAAIRWARTDPERHRVIPIFLNGIVEDLPYGLSVKHGLDLSSLGLEEVVAKLGLVARRMGAAPATPLPRPTPSTVDRKVLYTALCAIQTGSTYFDEIVMFEAPEAQAHLPSGPSSTPSLRAAGLVQWAALQGDEWLERIWRAVKQRAPGTLP